MAWLAQLIGPNRPNTLSMAYISSLGSTLPLYPWMKVSIFFGEISFRWPAIRKTRAKCRWEKFRQISVKMAEKSPKKRLQAKKRRNLQKNSVAAIYRRKFRFVSPILYRFLGKFPDISHQSSPRTGYKICPIFFFKKKNIRCNLVICS